MKDGFIARLAHLAIHPPSISQTDPATTKCNEGVFYRNYSKVDKCFQYKTHLSCSVMFFKFRKFLTWFNGYFPWIEYVVSFRIVLTSPMNKW